MKILVFADLHGAPTDCEMQCVPPPGAYDFCVSLGDNPPTAITKIQRYVHKPFYGIAGNHDTWETPGISGITDIHGKTAEYNKFLFAGFGGSHRYKNGSLAMLTQEESIELADKIPPCDMLFSHDTMYGELGSVNDSAHCGLKGISRYIRKNKVGVNICGHYHINRITVSADSKCKIICICGCGLIDTDDTDNVIHIF